MKITTYDALQIIRPHVSAEVYQLIRIEFENKTSTSRKVPVSRGYEFNGKNVSKYKFEMGDYLEYTGPDATLQKGKHYRVTREPYLGWMGRDYIVVSRKSDGILGYEIACKHFKRS